VFLVAVVTLLVVVLALKLVTWRPALAVAAFVLFAVGSYLSLPRTAKDSAVEARSAVKPAAPKVEKAASPSIF
jgi:hypothetical protein